MTNSDFSRLLTNVVEQSGAIGRAKRNLYKELESHIWEAVQELEVEGVPKDAIPTIVIERFGSPEEIGKQFELMHGWYKKYLRIGATGIGLLVFVLVLLPGDGGDAVSRYSQVITERYLDAGWYYRALELESDDPDACNLEIDKVMNAHVPDGIGIQPVPAGHVLTTCYTKWLILKFLPPIQIAGPEVEQLKVLHAMRLEGGLQSTDIVFGPDADKSTQEIAQVVLEDFIRTLAVGAGNLETGDPSDEPEGMGEAADRATAFSEAAASYGGELDQLVIWSPHVDPTNKAALLEAACERNHSCFEAENIYAVSVKTSGDDETTVEFTVQFKFRDEDVNKSWQFEVTRFEDGYPNDWTDDRFLVTKASFPSLE